MVLAGFMAPLSAQVLLGTIKIGDQNLQQQRRHKVAVRDFALPATTKSDRF